MPALLVLSLASLLPGVLLADVYDVTPADATPRSFSVVWVSDEPVTDATVRVFDDAVGTTELTGTLTVDLVSRAIQTAHDLGIVKVQVAGISPDSCYYVQTETTGVSGTVQSPSAAPFLEVCTEVATEKIDLFNQLISNDLIAHEVFAPDGVTPAEGALVLLSAPAAGSGPVTAFVGLGGGAQNAAPDMNNLFEAATGSNLEVAGGEVLQLTEMRGLLCAELADQKRTKFRRAPEHEEASATGVPITQAEWPDLCFFLDTHCDDSIDILDAQRVLNAFSGRAGDCRFNSDMDVVADQVIDVLDVQSVLNRFGETAPFTP